MNIQAENRKCSHNISSFILTAKPKFTKLVKDLEHLAHSKYSEQRELQRG